MYQKTTLPTTPDAAALPDDVEVRDFDLGDGRYARVIMEIKIENQNDVEHAVLYAQAYELDAAGQMVQAPLGYPSRSMRTAHSVIASAIGKTIEFDDAWVATPAAFDPLNPGDIPLVTTGKPTEPGTQYNQQIFDTVQEQMYRWTEGFADVTARTKIEDLLVVLNTSNIRSGLAFRNRAN